MRTLLPLFSLALTALAAPPMADDGSNYGNTTQTRGELAHHHKQFRPRVQKKNHRNRSSFHKFKSVQSWSGGCDPRSIMITVTELQNNSAPTRKKAAPPPFLSLDYLPSSGRLSSPEHKSFLAHFFVSKTTEHDGGGARLRAGFSSRKKTEKPNLSGQAGDTLTHLKALILIHNTKKKMVPATCLDQPTGLSARSTAVPERETFFLQT